MTRLTQEAKDTLREFGVTQAAWLRAYPSCDRCGCPDDRCIGYHHAEGEPCDLRYWLEADDGYHPAEITELLAKRRADWYGT